MTKSQRKRDSAVMMSSMMPSAKYSCSGSPLMFWNGRTAIDGLSGSGRAASHVDAVGSGREPRGRRGSAARCSSACCSPRSTKPTSTLPARPPGRGPTRRCRRGQRSAFQAGGDIDAIAQDVVALDDNVAEIDADAECQPVLGQHRASRSPISLDFSAQRSASTTLANSASSPSPVVLTMRPPVLVLRVDHVAQKARGGERAFLVGRDQPRVARHIGGYDGRQSSLDLPSRQTRLPRPLQECLHVPTVRRTQCFATAQLCNAHRKSHRVASQRSR